MEPTKEPREEILLSPGESIVIRSPDGERVRVRIQQLEIELHDARKSFFHWKQAAERASAELDAEVKAKHFWQKQADMFVQERSKENAERDELRMHNEVLRKENQALRDQSARDCESTPSVANAKGASSPIVEPEALRQLVWTMQQANVYFDRFATELVAALTKPR